jgi:hypothetical protein
VARVSCRRFRRSDEHTLQRHGYRRRHHEDNGDASEQGLSSEAQNCRPFGKPGQYPRGLYYASPGSSQTKSKPFLSRP